MTNFTERRKYQRCDTTICKVLMSTDRSHWNNLDICDISAGGLRFFSSKSFPENTKLYFDIYVYNMLSEFNLKFEGSIIRSERDKAGCYYAVKFENANKYSQIQLDEIIKSKITVAHPQPPITEDGVYTFLFIPRIKPKKLRLRI